MYSPATGAQRCSAGHDCTNGRCKACQWPCKDSNNRGGYSDALNCAARAHRLTRPVREMRLSDEAWTDAASSGPEAEPRLLANWPQHPGVPGVALFAVLRPISPFGCVRGPWPRSPSSICPYRNTVSTTVRITQMGWLTQRPEPGPRRQLVPASSDPSSGANNDLSRAAAILLPRQPVRSSLSESASEHPPLPHRPPSKAALGARPEAPLRL